MRECCEALFRCWLGSLVFLGRVAKVDSSVCLSLVGEDLLPVVSERGYAPGSIWSCDACVLKNKQEQNTAVRA